MNGEVYGEVNVVRGESCLNCGALKIILGAPVKQLVRSAIIVKSKGILSAGVHC